MSETRSQSSTISVTLVGRVKHTALWQAALRLGGVRALADALGVRYESVIAWINFTVIPSKERMESRRFSMATLEHMGMLPEDVWPAELVEKIGSGGRKRVLRFALTKQIPMGLLLGEGGDRPLLTDGGDPLDPESILTRKERGVVIQKAINRLSEKEEKVIHLRFVNDSTLAEASEAMCLSTERIRQIETKALRKLQYMLKTENPA